jgi:hypothetical protein
LSLFYDTDRCVSTLVDVSSFNKPITRVPAMDSVMEKSRLLSIISTAKTLEMLGIREKAIESLGQLKIGPVEKIQVAQQLDLPLNWALDAFEALCLREQSPSIIEGEMMGAAML